MGSLIKVSDLAKVQDVEFVHRFNGGINKLMKVLGITQPIKMAPGTLLKSYKTSGKLETGSSIGEGETIPLSKYQTEPDKTYELDFDKWRKQTSMEAISKRGYVQAVTETDNKMVRDVQKGIRKNIFDFLASGTGVSTGDTFQRAIANSWGKLNVAFEDDDATPVYFVNPMDIADYLGGASVTLQTAFGFSYIENFLGLGTVLVDSYVPETKVITTAQENINLYYADPSEIEGFEFYGDETGLIGVHHDTEYSNVTYETVATSALLLFPEYFDRIIVSSIEESV